jgi:CheY-like chemotaxis protein
VAPAFEVHVSQKTIMTADDSASIRQMVSHTLRQGGYRVLEAVDGEDALRMLDGHRVDLLITDLNMPKLGRARGPPVGSPSRTSRTSSWQW